MTDTVSTQQKEREGYITPSETQPVLDEELKTAGVMSHTENPELTKEHTDVGIRHSLEATPVTEDSGKVKLPFTEERAKEILEEEKSTNSSLRWLAFLVIRQFRRIHSRILNK